MGEYSLGTKCLAEYIGSFGAIYLCQSIVTNAIISKSKGHGMGFGWISFGYGMGFFFPILVFWDMPALFNPAFCIALWVLGSLKWFEVVALSSCQIVGAFCGAICVYIHWIPHFNIVMDDDHTDRAVKLACFTTSPGIYSPLHNFICEFLSTVSLVVGVVMIVDRLSMHDIFGPFFIGVYIIVMLLGLGGPTALSINPARDLGPRLAHWILPIPNKGSSYWKQYAWIPVTAALCGGAAGGGIALGIRSIGIIKNMTLK